MGQKLILTKGVLVVELVWIKLHLTGLGELIWEKVAEVELISGSLTNAVTNHHHQNMVQLGIFRMQHHLQLMRMSQLEEERIQFAHIVLSSSQDQKKKEVQQL